MSQNSKSFWAIPKACETRSDKRPVAMLTPIPMPPAIHVVEDDPTPSDFDPRSLTAPATTGRRSRPQKVNSQQDWRAALIPKKRGGKK
jgi:hypothetical protein